MARILGIDYGERRIGLAVSDPTYLIAQPLTTIIRRDSEVWWNELAAIIAEQEVEAIVVGYPRTLKGSASHQTQVVDQFITRLQERESLPIYRFDERLTSVAARRALQQQGIKTGHRKEAVDRTAAALMLQDYLDSQR
ncbi:MAG: Holliday junction resolvase RuvX [Fidelibacterota bacterium]|nr:MAG: Holliday junction resolvase RuvX [Candidatus Neomarinimicrobiota bacterium]